MQYFAIVSNRATSNSPLKIGLSITEKKLHVNAYVKNDSIVQSLALHLEY